MVSCKVRGCKNRSDRKGQPKLHFFSFPKDDKIASKWLEVCKKSINIKNSRVCSAHFKPSSYKLQSEKLNDVNSSTIGFRTLLPDAIPTENIKDEDSQDNITKNYKCSKNKKVSEKNIQEKCTSNVNQLSTNNNIPTVFFVHLLDNNLQPRMISSTPLTSVKCTSNKSNLDVRLERIEAPAHVLDHQYAVNKNPSYNFPNAQDIIESENSSLKTNKNISLEIKKVSCNKTSDQLLINQLKKQLEIKTIEQQTLQRQLKRLQNETKIIINKKVCDILKNVFSPRQIDRLMNPYKTQIKWSIEDIISAISLHNISLKAYRYLRENNYPLPSLATIKNWTARINVTEGVLIDILILMKYKAKSLSVFQKIVVLNFGEIFIGNRCCIICIVRGLFYKWMQPIYYSYDETLSVDILREIISKLYEIGYIVVAMTSNLKSSNALVWNHLNIGINNTQQCYFKHPNNVNYKVFVFPDENSLLIPIRKYFLTNGFNIKGKCVNKQCIKEIININSQLEGEEYHMLTELIEDSQLNEENVLLVKQLFAKTIGEEINSYGEIGCIHYKDWKQTANFFKLIDEWISLFSSKVKEGYKEGEEPYGLRLEQQNNILNKVKKLMYTMRVEGSEILMPFQEQVILRSISLQQLLLFLQESFSIEDFQIKYILTNRFNSELLENFNTYLSRKEPICNKSTILKFQSKLRKCLLGKYSFDSAPFEIKFTEPCIIDFNERSDSRTISDIQKQKKYVSGTAKKMRKFLTDNKISKQKVHRSLLHILSKNT